MYRFVISTMSVAILISACEKRKGTLLPSKTAGTEVHEQEMRARAPVDSQLPEGTTNKFDEAETQELERVKQDALDRIRAPGEGLTMTPGERPNARKLFERGRSLAAQGQAAEAQEYYLVSCQFGYIESCHKFGWYEQKGGNLANANQFYKVACAAGIGKSCNNLGVQLEAQKKWEDALNYYAQACLEHHNVSCENMKRLRNERLKLR